MISIRNLGVADAPEFLRLRRLALELEPHSFAASVEDDRALDSDFLESALRDPAQAIVGAFAPDLVGVVGICRDRLIKARHKAHIWGMYVSPEGRGKGTGRLLMEAALDWARRQPGVTQVHLVVSTRTPVARKLYSSLGFSTWGLEPAALRINGELIDDEHMVKRLESPAPPGRPAPG
jgi:ribosomal protein S18 acetylase RimI-like enzyme